MRFIETSDGSLELLKEAPPMIRPASARTPLLITTPDGVTCRMEWEEAAALHCYLGQELARGMRRRGSATDPIGPTDGGTAPAMALAA